MIIGNGLIASLFKKHDREDIIFFASGVSNSLETDENQFNREENLIRKTIKEHPNKTFIYFSTCSIYDSSKADSLYVLHKLRMEQIIKKEQKSFLIQRVSNVVGNGGNPHLLMNYIVPSVKKGNTIDVHTKATRNLIDAQDVKNITLENIERKSFNKVINVAYLTNYSIIEILEIIEEHYDCKLHLNLINKGSGYNIEIPEITPYFTKNNLLNKKNYLQQILKKYYP